MERLREATTPRIKDVASLIKRARQADDTTDELQNVWIFENGTWSIVDHNTTPNPANYTKEPFPIIINLGWFSHCLNYADVLDTVNRHK